MEGSEKKAPEVHVAPRGRRREWWKFVLAPATAALLLISALEWQENRRLTMALDETRQQVAELVNESQRMQMMVDVLSAPDTLSVILAATPQAAGGTGMVRYNTRRGIALFTAQLSPPPTNKTYQMWLVPAVGSPINAGVFLLTSQKTQQWWTAVVPANTAAKAFAVTVEPAGGVAQPTGPKVLLGNE